MSTKNQKRVRYLEEEDDAPTRRLRPDLEAKIIEMVRVLAADLMAELEQVAAAGRRMGRERHRR